MTCGLNFACHCQLNALNHDHDHDHTSTTTATTAIDGKLPQGCFFSYFFFFLLIFLFELHFDNNNDYHDSSSSGSINSNGSSSSSSTGSRRDMSRAEIFLSSFLFFYYTNFILGLFSTSERLWQQQHQHRLKMWITGAAGEEAKSKRGGRWQQQWQRERAQTTFDVVCFDVV
jgi:hypothetical protein